MMFLEELMKAIYLENATNAFIKCNDNNAVIQLEKDNSIVDYLNISTETAKTLISKLKSLANMNTFEKESIGSFSFNTNIDYKECDFNVKVYDSFIDTKSIMLSIAKKVAGNIVIADFDKQTDTIIQLQKYLDKTNGGFIIRDDTSESLYPVFYLMLSSKIKNALKECRIKKLFHNKDNVTMYFEEANIDFCSVFEWLFRQNPNIKTFGDIVSAEDAKKAFNLSLEGTACFVSFPEVPVLELCRILGFVTDENRIEYFSSYSFTDEYISENVS